MEKAAAKKITEPSLKNSETSLIFSWRRTVKRAEKMVSTGRNNNNIVAVDIYALYLLMTRMVILACIDPCVL